ncbi:MAG TPA: outer membrane beta-barrel protein, partial [Gemmatimonadaceae bacterium]
MSSLACTVGALLLLPRVLGAQAPAADTTTHVAFGGFVDGYFAYDFGRPRDIDRAFTTQAVRHDEFNVNLAFIDATLTGTRVRGRIAAQFGTAVQANYAAEPRV